MLVTWHDLALELSLDRAGKRKAGNPGLASSRTRVLYLHALLAFTGGPAEQEKIQSNNHSETDGDLLSSPFHGWES